MRRSSASSARFPGARFVDSRSTRWKGRFMLSPVWRVRLSRPRSRDMIQRFSSSRGGTFFRPSLAKSGGTLFSLAVRGAVVRLLIVDANMDEGVEDLDDLAVCIDGIGN